MNAEKKECIKVIKEQRAIIADLQEKISHANSVIQDAMFIQFMQQPGSFNVGDTIVNKEGKRGICKSLRFCQWSEGGEVHHSGSTYLCIRKDGKAGVIFNIHGYQEWKKAS